MENTNNNNNTVGGKSAIKAFIFHKQKSGELFTRMFYAVTPEQYKQMEGEFNFHVKKKFEALNEISRKYTAGEGKALFSNTRLKWKLDYRLGEGV